MTQDNLCTIELVSPRFGPEFREQLLKTAEELRDAMVEYDFDADLIDRAADLLQRAAQEG